MPTISARSSLVAGLLALATCACDEPTCNFETGDGCTLNVAQLLVNDAEPDDPVSRLKIGYGVVRGVNQCDDPGGADPCPEGTSCQGPFGPLQLRGCVDGDGRFPIARSVPTTGVEIRVVFDRLLNGSTVEQFACDCAATGGVCAAGNEYSSVPYSCTACQSGRCFDADGDGLADVTALRPGVATIRCGELSYVTGTGDGIYQPNGNQFLPATTGLAGLGPALVLRPAVTLPADRDCTIELSASVRDKNGHSVSKPAQPLGFHTR